MITVKRGFVKIFQSNYPIDLPEKCPALLEWFSHSGITIGRPLANDDKNLAVLLTLSVTSTVQVNGESTTSPPANKQTNSN